MQTPPSAPDLLRTFLESRDVPCPGCAYNLRAVTAEACPECGLRLELSLRGESFYRKWWWLPIVALVTSGISALYGACAWLYSLSGSKWWTTWSNFYLYLGESVVYAIVSFTAARWAWKIRREPPPVGWRNPFVICAGLLLLGNLLSWFMSVVHWLLATLFP